MFASIALYSWPIVSHFLFRRYAVLTAVAATVLGGYLLLPTQTGYDPPLLPEIDKKLMPFLAVLILFGSRARAAPQDILPGWWPRLSVFTLLTLLLMMSVVLTTLTNSDPLYYGLRTLPGLTPMELGSELSRLLVMFLPIIVGWKYLGSDTGNKVLLQVFILAALGYSILALYEIRMSPQLNNMVYGFFPHQFAQHYRNGGWRPIVFFDHGLILGVFFCMSTIAAAAAWRMSTDNKSRALAIFLFLFVVLVLSKVMTALVITLAVLPVIFMSARTQLFAALAIAVIAVGYPALRSSNVVPTERIVASFEAISKERASSLAFRFRNEDAMLEKARERKMFGWGGWGRARLYSESGVDITVTDGYWLIVFSDGGWLRYIAEFGILMLPILLLLFTGRQKGSEITGATSALALMLVANMLDLLPNAGLTPLTFLVAGALYGNISHRRRGTASPEQAEAEPEVAAPRAGSYTRFGGANGEGRGPAGPGFQRPPPRDQRPPLGNQRPPRGPIRRQER